MSLLKCLSSKKCCSYLLTDTGRRISSSRHLASSACNLQNSNVDQPLPRPKNGATKPPHRHEDRDLVLSVLNASTTKRDAKAYLSRYPRSKHELRVAFLKIRGLQYLDDNILRGLAHTLSHVGRLGTISIVVPDCTPDSSANLEIGSSNLLQNMHMDQADRIVSAIEANHSFNARRLDCLLGKQPQDGLVQIEFDDILFRTLRANIIPVIPPVAYFTDTQRKTDVSPDDVMLALARQLAPLSWKAAAADNQKTTPPPVPQPQTEIQPFTPTVLVDRIVILDPLGGLPSAQRPDKAHVFVNLQQEYQDIRKELEATNHPEHLPQHPSTNPLQRHVQNLDLLKNSLSLLPPTSSALLTSPAEAAILSPSEQPANPDLGVKTRTRKNPLIHNLLTDKPLISPSLPVKRFKPSTDNQPLQPGRATFFKQGMSVTMIPDPRTETWEAPSSTKPSISLVDDPRIDFPRLQNLIEDSFKRPLDVQHFLNRIQNRTAGVIVAGDYEGGALFTWELPPDLPDDGSDETRKRMVPYLDKFAVLKRAQGAGGISDVLFSAMVRSCFPHGVCWRSRKDNPVNKWYFERARGTWKLPNSDWTMFWTTHGLLEDKQRFSDYEAVCRNIGPSWADNKKPE